MAKEDKSVKSKKNKYFLKPNNTMIKQSPNRLVLLIFFFSVITAMFGQNKHCSSPKKKVDEFLTISKCAVKIFRSKKNADKKKPKNQLSVRIVGARVRRDKVKSMSAIDKSINGIAAVVKENEGGVQSIQTTTVMKNLSKRLSAAEVAASIPLSAIKNIPLFPKCKKSSLSKLCFNEELGRHVQNHLHYPKEAIDKKVEGDVWVRFIIDKEGGVGNIEVRGPNGGSLLEQEAKRVIAELPKFKPATYNGKQVSVKYAFPINFKLEELQ